MLFCLVSQGIFSLSSMSMGKAGANPFVIYEKGRVFGDYGNNREIPVPYRVGTP